MNEDREVEIKL